MKLELTNLAAGVFLFSSAVSPAYAYLDPGTGSILVQGLIAAIAGGLYMMKVYWSRLTAFFARLRKKPNGTADTKSEDNQGPNDSCS